MLTQAQANRLIEMLKEAARKDVLVWQKNLRQDELVVGVGDGKLQFVMTMKRGPFEIRLHLRTQDRNIALVRLDAAPYHTNPDGKEIRNQPHLHIYREGHELAFAEPVEWYDVDKPLKTFERFLEFIRTRFPAGHQLDLI
jgi:hypothetical protein